jgi:hypothetical protein
LDLVTGVIFPGDVNAEFTYNDAAGNITVAIPNTATDGPITLRCVAGDVPAPDVMLVKPAITSIMPATIQAGDPITIAGADLDLVTGITVGGKDGSLTSQSETEIQAATPMDASIAGTGVEVALTLANGTFVTATIDVTFPAYCFILEFPAPDVEIKAGELLQVIIENSDKLTGVEVNGSATQYILQGTALYILIPGNAGGQTSLKLISDNGDAEYTIDVVGTGPVETVIFNEIHDFVDWNSAEIRLYKEDFANVPVGSKLKFYFTVNGTGQMNMSDANWVKLDFPDDPYWDGQWQQLTFNNASLTSHEIVLTQDVLSKIMTADDGWSTTAIVIKGNLLIVSKISLITGGDH